MQSIAAENNLSETAFFVPKDDQFEITWFTPLTEVDLCGHATLASAHVLFNHLLYEKEVIRFSTRYRGDVSVRRSNDLLMLDFPATDPEPIQPVGILEKALGNQPVELYKTRDYLAIFPREQDIINIKPDFNLLKELGSAGIIISAPGVKSDFVSRFFAPGFGIDEDPVTGSAHTTLIPYWSKRLRKDKLHAFQLSKRRGELFCEYLKDRVLIGGKSVTYLIGELVI
jgi:PhzF family phenazine biosynthesis protein